MTDKQLKFFMTEALKEASDAMTHAELPIGTVITANNKIIARGSTRVRRENSICAHGELFSLLKLEHKVYSEERPLTIYTTLEPCIMCLGASIQATIDKIVYGMKAAPDGGVFLREEISKNNMDVPEIIGGICEGEQVELFREFKNKFGESPAIDYVDALLKPYN